MQTEMNEKFVGVFEAKVKDARTGEIIETIKENNVVVAEGKRHILLAFTQSGTGDQHVIKQISVGQDYGNPAGGWTENNPEPATADFNYLNMEEDFKIPTLTTSIPNQSQNVVQFNAILKGEDAVAQWANGQEQYDVCSACLHFGDTAGAGGNPTVFAYKRFKSISITDLVDIDITWTVTYV